MTGRTVSELATRIGVSKEIAGELLADFAARGIAVEQDGKWRLSELGEARFGQAVRNLTDDPEPLEDVA